MIPLLINAISLKLGVPASPAFAASPRVRSSKWAATSMSDSIVSPEGAGWPLASKESARCCDIRAALAYKPAVPLSVTSWWRAHLLRLPRSRGLKPSSGLLVRRTVLAGHPPEAPGALLRGAALFCKRDYATLVSPATRDPVWVAEHLTTVQVMSAGMISRHCRFRPAPALAPGSRAELHDYRHSGWGRGHRALDADMPDEQAQQDSRDLANAGTQAPRLNRGA